MDMFDKEEEEIDSRVLTENIAQYLWLKYDCNRPIDDWNKESEDRKAKWIDDAEGLRVLIDEYYEE